jgi:hypothetical protein
MYHSLCTVISSIKNVFQMWMQYVAMCPCNAHNITNKQCQTISCMIINKYIVKIRIVSNEAEHNTINFSDFS